MRRPILAIYAGDCEGKVTYSEPEVTPFVYLAQWLVREERLLSENYVIWLIVGGVYYILSSVSALRVDGNYISLLGVIHNNNNNDTDHLKVIQRIRQLRPTTFFASIRFISFAP